MDLRCTPAVRAYMRQGIRHVCAAFKGRAAGTAAEAGAQAYFAQALASACDRVAVEPFALHPKAFLGWLIPAGIFDLASVAIYWLRGVSDGLWIPIAGMCIYLSFFMDLFEFVLYRRFHDRLWPRATSHNVYATRAPIGEVRRRIIFCGHADAAHEMRFARLGGKRTLGPILMMSTVGALYMMAVNTAVLVRALQGTPAPLAGIWLWLGVVALLFVPSFVGLLFFMNWGRVVDGANDNLTGCYVAQGVMKVLADAGVRPMHTEVGCLITGAEEAGLRGAMAFGRAHAAALSDVETVLIAVDTMRETNQLMVYTRGQNGLVQNSLAVGRLLMRAAESVGHPIGQAKLFLGATDAEAFARAGLKACGFCGVNHDPQPYYHTRYDTADNIDMDCVALSLDICLKALSIFDKEGLGGQA